MVLKVVSGGPLNGPVYYQGTWDANTNTPNLQSGLGFTGEYYIVSVAGNTTLDGNTNWQVGDWAVFNGATNLWEKIDGSGSYGTTLRIQNDSSGNVEYNITMSNVSSGLIDTEFVDNGVVTFNPSDNYLKTPNLQLTIPNGGENYIRFRNQSGVDKALINTYDNIYGNDRGYFEIYVYDGSNPQGNNLNFNGYGAFGFDDNFGTAGQVLISAGSTGKTYWGNANSVSTLNIVNDNSSSTVYNIAMTTATSGSISTEYVDNIGLLFKPSGTGYADAAFKTTSGKFTGTLVLSPSWTDDSQAFVLGEAYTTNGGTVTMYTPGDSGSFSLEPVAWNKYGYLGLGLTDTNYNVPFPLTVTKRFGSATAQVFITENMNQSTDGLKIIHTGSGASTLSTSGNLVLATNSTTYVTINTSGAVGVGSSPSYGNTGQVLTSQGSGSPPVWSSLITTPIVTKTSNYTATANDETILVNAAGLVTITLPTAVGIAGKIYTIKKIDSTAYAVTVATTSSQTIDGVTTYTLSNQYGGVNVQSDGSNWYIIGNIWGRNGTTGTF